MAVIGVNYNERKPVIVPGDVVQWRVVAKVDDVVVIHMARGDGTYEERYVNDVGNCYVPGELVKHEREGGDGICIFIEREW